MILITAFAILIAAVVEAQTAAGLSNFHASVVPSLSWMNNTNTFIYYLLYVQHKSLGDTGGIVGFPSWIQHIRDEVSMGLRNGASGGLEPEHQGKTEPKPPRSSENIFTILDLNPELNNQGGAQGLALEQPGFVWN
ncbi:hypothetical protein B0H13DRAFT_2551387 [Mycena leptocephala]|nr:hypothetical protein B0H13DRAFT_2551387 [Mycena leptocephala]